jgi:hypothetical protein
MKIQLDRGDFYELQALSLKVENARLVAAAAATALQTAQASAQARLTALAALHEFDVTDSKRSLSLDEATYSLVVGEGD